MYRRSVSQPLLRYLNNEEHQQALEAVHEGICGEHLAGRSLAFKILRQGFFWPTMRADTSDYAKRCVQYQLFATIPKQPPEEMTSKFSSFDHPQGNGAIEAANKVIFRGIKKRLGEAKGRWAEELPWILWACRTTPRTSTGDTPFRMAYGTEALVPVEANVDLLEEEREAEHQRNMRYLLQMAQHYDSNVKKRSFGFGDLVLRELAASMPAKQGKLQPNWEGPYKVIEVIHPGTYKLETLSG
ncbi:uncharacterized protein LOC141665792 [Apium graveolens]|uniref:uncharacterized protein LOC141665792 n=1 Tax=Apium graveolens TaxID=4045 RepID=UPI003D7A29FD